MNYIFYANFLRLVLYKIFDKLSELDKNREAVTKKIKFLSETKQLVTLSHHPGYQGDITILSMLRYVYIRNLGRSVPHLLYMSM